LDFLYGPEVAAMSSQKGESKHPADDPLETFESFWNKKPPLLDLDNNPIEKICPTSLLLRICKRLEIELLEERDDFIRTVIFATARYVDLKNANTNRIPTSVQMRQLDEFKRSIEQLQDSYAKILGNIGTRTKFHIALEKIATSIPKDSHIVRMLDPYVTIGDSQSKLGGISPFVLADFLTVLIDAGEQAKTVEAGHEKTNLTPNYLAWWVATIRTAWPKDSPIRFGLGDYQKENETYKSPSLEILDDLISTIDPEVTLAELTTAVRKVVKTDTKQNPANFLLA
jgi:hypothetical protein